MINLTQFDWQTIREARSGIVSYIDHHTHHRTRLVLRLIVLVEHPGLRRGGVFKTKSITVNQLTFIRLGIFIDYDFALASRSV